MGPTIPERLMRVETQLEHQSEQIKELRDQVAKLETGVDEIKEILTQAKGGWRVFVWVGGIASIVGTGASWAIGKLWPLMWTLPR